MASWVELSRFRFVATMISDPCTFRTNPRSRRGAPLRNGHRRGAERVLSGLQASGRAKGPVECLGLWEHALVSPVASETRIVVAVGGCSTRLRLDAHRGAAIVAVAVLAFDAAPSLAVDGVLEISQSCAEGPGCFPGDAAGFPVVIANSGSYRLTSDLDAPDTATNAIEIDADDVHLDLNGFVVRGKAGCESEAACAPAAGGGIIAGELLGDRVTIRQGTVQSFGGDGFVLRHHALIENVSVAGIAGDGIRLTSGGRIAGTRVSGFFGTGIVMGPNTLYGENSILDFAQRRR